MADNANEYKYEVGDLVHVSPTALEQLPLKNRKRAQITFKSTLFTIAKRRDDPTIQYFVPGYDWQGGDSWVDESFLSKWAGSGPLRLSVTVDSEGATAKEREAYATEMTNKLHAVCKDTPVVDIKYIDDPAAELDNTG